MQKLLIFSCLIGAVLAAEVLFQMLAPFTWWILATTSVYFGIWWGLRHFDKSAEQTRQRQLLEYRYGLVDRKSGLKAGPDTGRVRRSLASAVAIYVGIFSAMGFFMLLYRDRSIMAFVWLITGSTVSLLLWAVAHDWFEEDLR